MDTPARKQRGAEKTARIPIKIVPAERLPKPEWIRIKLGAGPEAERFNEIKATLREHKLHTVCEEASCPNIHECFGKGTATFMIMGDICTRRCPFCDVGHGRPDPLNADEPRDLAKTIAAMRLNYVVITSVDRDDLRDGGAQHFVDCIRETRAASPGIRIEILTPDFRGKGRMERALEILRASPPDADEPLSLARTIADMGLKYVVITSVDRDDLRDGGAQHFVECIRETRAASPQTTIEVLVPDFRGRMEIALDIFDQAPPDVMNHNLETVPRLYRQARPGSDYAFSLELLKQFKARHPEVLTKSGLMVGLGETDEEILEVLRDLRAHNVDMLTIGQYLQPSGGHLPVLRYPHPDVFKMYETEALKLGFRNAACGPMVRSSYWADQQALGAGVT